MAFRDQDIPALFADMGVTVVANSITSKGLLDLQDQVLTDDRGQGGVVIPIPTVILRTSDFPALKIDDPITVGGVPYSVRDRLRQGDGGLTKVLLGVA